MARSETAWLFAAAAVAISVSACSDILGLGDYAVCSDDCDAGGDAAPMNDVDAQDSMPFDAPPLVDVTTHDTGPFGEGGGFLEGGAPRDGQAGDGGPPMEAGAIDAALYWAHWPMPNPSEIADAQGLPNPSSYAVDGGVVVDRVTSLRWRVAVGVQMATLAQATAYCAELDGGWRLPTRIELVSLIDFARQGPAIDPTFVADDAGTLITAKFWTASPGWVVDFSTGAVTSDDVAQLARCVSVGAMKRPSASRIVLFVLAIVSPALAWGPGDQYATFGPDDETITDIFSSLVWQRASTGATLTQAAAVATCESLTIGGVSTWRLPTVKELLTLVEDTPHVVYQNGEDVESDIDSNAFYDTVSTCFWTSSFAGSTSSAFVVSMKDGQATLADPMQTTCAARCVER